MILYLSIVLSCFDFADCRLWSGWHCIPVGGPGRSGHNNVGVGNVVLIMNSAFKLSIETFSWITFPLLKSLVSLVQTQTPFVMKCFHLSLRLDWSVTRPVTFRTSPTPAENWFFLSCIHIFVWPGGRFFFKFQLRCPQCQTIDQFKPGLPPSSCFYQRAISILSMHPQHWIATFR
jgi:hypothetical protein